MGFRLPYWEDERTGLWHPAFPTLGIRETPREDVEELIAWIEEGGLVEAHAHWFEFCMWRHQLVPKFGFPSIADDQWRCSAAKAASHALPRALDDALHALASGVAARLMGVADDGEHMGRPRKDAEGQAVMRKVSKPRRPRKKELEICARHGLKPRRYYWHASKTLYTRLWVYCRQDVLAEESLSQAIPDLSDAETAMFHMDRAINERGFQLDQAAVSTALTLIAEEERVLNAELATITGGVVKRATQRAQMIKWLATKGVHLEDTQAATITETLEDYEAQNSFHGRNLGTSFTVDPAAMRTLALMKELGRSSTAKYSKMRDWMDSDGRVRGGLLYHGASTGRWSGAGVQPHNFVRGAVHDVEGLWQTLKNDNRESIAAFPDAHGRPVGSVMDALANALRGAIVAAPGCQLFVADYSSIEARVLLWIAGDENGLNIFRSGRDIYCEMASEIYKRPITKDDALERQVGKQAILGLGYQMGASKFQTTVQKAGIEISGELAQVTVDTYREKFYPVKQLWYAQEEAACAAVAYPGGAHRAGKIRWQVEDRFLYCTLPSGRRLAFPDPEIRERSTPWGDVKPSLTYKSINAITHKWERQASYGGLLVENIVQAASRDVLAEAMLRVERSGTYQVVLSVHDEVIAESRDGNLDQFNALITRCPRWASGCPVAADSWTGERYKKA